MKNTESFGEPKLYGLVLSGGKSTRMGQDKNVLDYHGLPQQEYLYDLLERVCGKTYLSIRSDQHLKTPEHLNTILDQNEYRGPFNGILSAHKAFPDVAWLILACDLPLLGMEVIAQLVNERDSDHLATAMATKVSGLPEPLVAIWEPKGLKKAINYLKESDSTCPRKFLIRSGCKLVYPEKDETLLNANSQEDFKEALSKSRST